MFGDESDRILSYATPQIGTVTLEVLDCPLFDEELRLNEDVEGWLRMSQQFRIPTVPFHLHQFREHDGPRITGRSRDRLRYAWLLIEKHAAYFAGHP